MAVQWAGESDECLCPPSTFADDVAGTLECPLPWRWVPAEGIWEHP